MTGLISWYAGFNVRTTSLPYMNKRWVGNTYLVFSPETDNDDRYIDRSIDTILGEKMRVPTAERAISESLLHMDVTEEGLLAEAIIEYSNTHHGDLRKLHQVAREYNVDEALTQWIHDIEEQDHIKLE